MLGLYLRPVAPRRISSGVRVTLSLVGTPAVVDLFSIEVGTMKTCCDPSFPRAVILVSPPLLAAALSLAYALIKETETIYYFSKGQVINTLLD